MVLSDGSDVRPVGAPGGQQRQGARRPRVGLDGVDDDVLAVVPRGYDQLDVEVQVAGDRVPDAPLTPGVLADPVIAPPALDVRVGSAQLLDVTLQAAVLLIPGGLTAHPG